MRSAHKTCALHTFVYIRLMDDDADDGLDNDDADDGLDNDDADDDCEDA